MAEEPKKKAYFSEKEANEANIKYLTERKQKGESPYVLRPSGYGLPVDENLEKESPYNPFVNTYEQAYDKAFSDQSAGDIFLKTVKGFGKQALAGILSQISGWDLKSQLDMFEGNYTSDYTNWFSREAMKILKESGINDAILNERGYRGKGSWAYWGGQLQSLGLSTGIMLETIGEQALLQLLAGATLGGSEGVAALRMGKTLKNIASMSKLRNALNGAWSGIREAHMNALFTANEQYEEYIKKGVPEDTAIKLSNEAATKAFRVEALPVALINGLQYGALGTFSPYKKLNGVHGVSDAVESLASKLVPKLGKKGAWIADKVIQSGSEAFEEAYQSGIASYGKYLSDKKMDEMKLRDSEGNLMSFTNGRTLSEYIFNDQIADEAIGGALGGLLLPFIGGGISKLVGKFQNNKFNKKFEEEYNSLLKSGIKKTFDELNELKDAVETDNPVKLNLARKAMNTSQTIEALRWDKIKGSDDTHIFNDRIAQMQIILEAAKNNDLETLKKYNITEQQDIEFIADNYENLIQQSLDIKEKLIKNVGNSIDYNFGERLTEKEFIKENNLSELNRLKAAREEFLLKSFEDASPELKEYLKAQSELYSLMRTTKLNDSQKQRKKELEKQLESMKTETFDPNNLSEEDEQKIKTYESQIQQLEFYDNTKIQLEKALTDLNRDISKLSDTKGQVEERKKEIIESTKNIDKIKNINILENKRSDLKRFNLLTDELDNKINSRIQEIKAEEKALKKVKVETEDKKSEKKRSLFRKQNKETINSKDIIDNEKDEIINKKPDENISKEDELEKQAINELLDYVDSQNEKPRETSEPFNPLDYPGVGRINTDNKSIEDRFSDAAKKEIEKAKRQSKKPSFKEFADKFTNHNKESAEIAYDYIVKAWKNNNEQFDIDPEKYYEDNFEEVDVDELLDLTDKEYEKKKKAEGVKSEQNIENNQNVEEKLRKSAEDKINSKEAEDYGTDENTNNNKENLDNVEVTIPFSGLESVPFYNKLTGKIEYVDTNTEQLNEKTKSDLNILLNPNLLVEGETFEIRYPEENWRDQEVNIWYENEDKIRFYKIGTMREWMLSVKDSSGKHLFTKEDIEKNPSEWSKEQYETWAGKVPLYMWYSGNKVGIGIHDVEWYDEKNRNSIKDASTSKQKDFLKKQKILHLRLQILNGNNKMVVTNRISNRSRAFDRKDAQGNNNPKRSLSQEQPNAILGCKKDRNLYVKNEDGTVTILERNQIENYKHFEELGEGSTINLIQSNVKNGKPIYVIRAITTNDSKSQERYKELAQTVTIIENAKKLFQKSASGSTLTEAEKSLLKEYNKIRTEILKLTNNEIDIAESGLNRGFSLISNMYPGHPYSYKKNAIDSKGNPVLKEKQEFRMEISISSNLSVLPIIKRNQDGTYEVTSVNYLKELRDNLTTQQKYYQIVDIKTGKKISIAHYQPIIEFDLVNKEVVIEDKEKEQKGEKEASGNNEDNNGNTGETSGDNTYKPIESINNGQRQRVVNYLFAQVLKNLGNNEISYGDIIRELTNSYKNLLDTLSKDPKRKAEFEYLSRKDVRDEILGRGKFSGNHNTLKEKIELYIDKEIDDSDIDNYENVSDSEIDNDSNIIKKYDSAGFEYNVKNGLSSRLKRMFAAIPKEKNKSTLDEFAGLDDYYEIDEVFNTVQDILSDIPNSVEDFLKALDKKLKRNPKNFEFLNSVKERFNNADKQLQNEILYKLNQTKNTMFFIMYDNIGNGYSFTTANANAKDPVGSTKRGFFENFKNSSVVKRTGENYILNMKKSEEVINTFERWIRLHKDTNYENLEIKEIVEWLSNFGIHVTEKTIEDLKNKELNGNIDFENFFEKALFKKLYDNIKEIYNEQKNSLGKNEPIKQNRFDKNSIVRKGIDGYMGTLAAIEVENNTKNEVVQRIAGKNVMPYSQPNAASEQVRKLLDSDNVMIDNLIKTSFSANSILLRVLKNSPKFKKNKFGIGYVSLQALKNRKATKNSDKAGITELPGSDFDVTIIAFNSKKTNPIKDATDKEMSDNGISLVEGKLVFPPLSDSSQLFYLDTVKYDIKDTDIFDIEGNIKLSDRLLQVLYEQLVLPDLKRIVEYIQAKNLGLVEDDVDFQNLGSELFTIVHSLNTLKVDGIELITLIRKFANMNMTLENIISDDIMISIKNLLQDMILENLKSKFNVKSDGTIEGSFVKEGIITVENNKIKEVRIDKDFLKEKSDTNNVERQVTTATADFIINHIINQAQIQMVFSGDMNNYTEKPSKLFDKDTWNNAKDTLTKIKLEDKNVTDKSVTDADIFFYIMSTKTEKERKSLYNQYFKLTGTNLYKRLKELLSPGNRIAESKGKKYIQIVVNDKETASESIDSLINLWYPEDYKKEENKSLIKEFKDLSKEIEDNIESKSLSKESLKQKKDRYKELNKIIGKKFSKIKDYLNITSTDGQEFTTWKEHLDILYYQGRLSDKEYDSIKKKLESQSNDGVNKNNRLSHDEKKAVFQPIKPLHSGLYFESRGEYTRQRYVYIKTSSFPLIPEMTKGFKIDNIRKNIEKVEENKGLNVRVTYKSGIKVGGVKNCIDIEDLYDDYDNIKYKLESSSIILDRENFSIQQDKPYKLDKNIEQGKDDKNNRGTQIDKILFGNGINKIKNDVFPNMFDKSLLEAVGIDSSKKLLSGKELYKIYNHIAILEQESFKRELFDELNINPDNSEWYNSYETLDKIQRLLNSRMSNYQDREIIKLKIKTLDKNGRVRFVNRETMIKENLTPIGAEFEIPLWISPNSQKFESVINSIINNRFIKLEISGSSSPVGSEEGFKLKDFSQLSEKDKGDIIFTDSFDGSLKATHYADGKLKSAQVLLPSKFRRKVAYIDDNGKTQYKDELIDLHEYTKTVDGKVILDTDRVDKEILTFFSFRIPTSSHQSGAIIEVVGFLPHASGDLMIVPKDHVTQIGEDFDIDVRYYYKQYITEVTEDGVKKIRKLNENDIPQSSTDRLNELYKQYNIEKKRIKEETNQFIDSIWRDNKETLYTLLFAKIELEAIQKQRVIKQGNRIFFDETLLEKEKELEQEIEFLENSLLSDNSIKQQQKELKIELANQLETLKDNLNNSKLEIFSNFVTERAIDKLKQKVLENNMIALYKSVYSTQDKETQKKINATLTTDFANSTANLIEAANNSVNNRYNYSILDDISQKEALRLGASGKLGIGVHSKWVVFNSLLQQQDEPIRIISHYIKDDEGRDVPVYLDMTIGRYTSEGYLGKANDKGEFLTLDGKRSIATVNMENQNCSTDNQKLQIMGKRNENKYTINVFALLCNLGFDTDTLSDGTEVHLPSLFISQPIIKRYVELMEQKDSMFTSFDLDANKKITETLKKEFGDNVNFIENTDFMENYDEVSQKLTGQTLLDNITLTDNEIQWAIYQKFIQLNSVVQDLNNAMNLLNIEKDGLGISFFNTIDKKDALIEFLSGKKSLDIENIDKLFGELAVVSKPGSANQYLQDKYEERIKNLINEGYIFLAQDEFTGEEYYAKPTTSQNTKIIYSISIGYNLWKDIFPFEDPTLKKIIEDILSISKVKKNSIAGQELKYFILENMKDFLYSIENDKLFTKPIVEERKSLTIDDETTGNESLAHYLERLRNSKEGSFERNLMEQPFFKHLELIINNDSTTPSYIKYSTNSNSNINKNDAYIILESMLHSNQKLPSYNGNENYTVHDLLKDLVKYSLLANQERGAIGFRNYLPVSALKEFGVLDNLKKIATVKNNHYQMIFNGYFRAITSLLKTTYDNETNFIPNRKGSFTENELRLLDYYIKMFNNSMNDDILIRESNGIRVKTDMYAENNSIFIEQFYQHNPDKALKIPLKDKNKIINVADSNNIKEITKFIIKDENYNKDFLAIKNTDGSFMLFKNIGNLTFIRIPLLGSFGMNEYQSSKHVDKSIYDKNNFDDSKLDKSKPKVTPEVKEKTTSDIIKHLLSNSNNSELKVLLQELKEFDNNIKVIPIKGLNANKGLEGIFLKEKNIIYIDADIYFKMNTEQFEKVFLEEYIHSITSNVLGEWINFSGITFENGKVDVKITIKPEKQGLQRPYYIDKFIGLYKEGVKAYVDNLKNKEEGIKKLKELNDYFRNILEGKKTNTSITHTSDEQDAAYRLFSIDEFIAGIFVSPEFREIMNKTEYRGTGKSILQHFKDIVKRIINALTKNTVDNSITEHVIDNLFNMLNKKDIIKESGTVHNTMEEFTNHSGGAYGADTMWDIIGRRFGVTDHRHYKDAGNANLSQQLRNNGVKAKILTEEQMDFARQKIKELLGVDYSIKDTDSEKQILQKNLQVRNYYQVANADAVYAIAKINNDNKSVSGGTNTAVQLGIKLNKPVYVWDINTEQWYKFEGVNNSFSVAIIPQNLISGETAFGTTQVANEKAKELLGPKPTSIDMIEAGIRTRTTRSVGEMEKYNIKVGDIVTQRGKSADGSIKEIKTRITAIHPKGTPEFLGNWDKEGWTQEGIDAIKRYKDGAAAIEFEVITNNLDNNSGFIPTETPTLTKNFAGIGTRDIENYSVIDKNTNKWISRKEYVGDEKAQKAQKAIEEVYQKTKDSINNKTDTIKEAQELLNIEAKEENVKLEKAMQDMALEVEEKNIKTGTIVKILDKEYKVINNENEDIKFVPLSQEEQSKRDFLKDLHREDFNDIDNILGKPSFEILFSQGIIETQGFQLTLSEFNSMTKEEQENFKKCL